MVRQLEVRVSRLEQGASGARRGALAALSDQEIAARILRIELGREPTEDEIRAEMARPTHAVRARLAEVRAALAITKAKE